MMTWSAREPYASVLHRWMSACSNPVSEACSNDVSWRGNVSVPASLYSLISYLNPKPSPARCGNIELLHYEILEQDYQMLKHRAVRLSDVGRYNCETIRVWTGLSDVGTQSCESIRCGNIELWDYQSLEQEYQMLEHEAVRLSDVGT